MDSFLLYSGKIEFDLDKPDGTLRKIMDSSRLKKLGWTSKINLDYGLKMTYDWYKKQDKVLLK